jgi:hypothetical protein
MTAKSNALVIQEICFFCYVLTENLSIPFSEKLPVLIDKLKPAATN